MKNLVSRIWWKAAGFRALRTALAIAVPYLPTVIYENTWAIVASTAGFGALLSLLTSLRGVEESSGKVVPWYHSLFERSVKTVAQALITAVGVATTFEAVSWETVPAIVGTSLLVTLTAAVLTSLPGTEEPTARKTVTLTSTDSDTGLPVEEAVPVVAAVPAEVAPAAASAAPIATDDHGK